MKKHFLLLFLFCMAACNKGSVKPARDISGDYTSTVHYLHTWIVSQTNYGTVLDTNYTTPFHIGYSNDTITVLYNNVQGTGVTEKLVYQSAASWGDTFRYAGLWNGYSYKTTYLSFYRDSSISRFTYTSKDHTNPSGGGNEISYTIKGQ